MPMDGLFDHGRRMRTRSPYVCAIQKLLYPHLIFFIKKNIGLDKEY
jgi:hypothetical protein